MAIKIVSLEELEKAESILYNWLKNELKPIKMPDLIKWMKEKFPNMELHHIFGSHTSIKSCDLVVPLTRTEHIRAEKDKSGTTMLKYLPRAINYLMQYVEYQYRSS